MALLRLLAAWTAYCEPAARLLLRSPSNLFIVELLSARGGIYAQAATLLQKPMGKHDSMR